MTMIVLMILPPGIVALMATVNPGFMKPLLYDPLGHNLIALGISLQVIGFLFIRRIIEIKV